MRRSIMVAVMLVVVPTWSVSILLRRIPQLSWDRSLYDSRISLDEAVVLSHVGVLAASIALMACAIPWRRAGTISMRGAIEHLGVFRRPVTWLSMSAVVAPVMGADTASSRVEASVPAGAVLSPAVASAVLAKIIRRRRQQIESPGIGIEPDRLTEEEVAALASLRRIAIECDSDSVQRECADVDGTHDPMVRLLLDAVDRPRPSEDDRAPWALAEWKIMVRVFGYPTVENTRGERAEFRKRRSLELLTWLVLNRDRQRRSAARTAMWEVDVSDSTFSTVISDMRRALTELDRQMVANAWCPPTYSDEIPLSPRVVTDADLLAGALRRFRSEPSDASDLLNCLSLIRDVPFAGTAYSWADLDGTTTRLVILAVDAATTAARWGRENGRPDVVTAAVTAGLRVMPGCEELLGMQEELITATPRRQTRRIH